MPIETFSAEDVMRTAGRNSHRNYPTRTKGLDRLLPYPQVAMQGRFTFGTDARIFTTGSCFARNIEKALKFIGIDVVSSPDTLHFPTQTPNLHQMYNKYTVHSILNELEWALGDNPPDPADLIYEVEGGKWLDMQINKYATGTREEVIALRQGFNDTFKAAAEADVIIMTLGLVECWYDKDLGVYLNMGPTRGALKRYPGRFEYHTLSYDDIYDALCRIHDLLQAKCKTPPKMLCTVSPVPLQTTFRNQDVLVANSYSKAVQRAAVDAFSVDRQVDYFPSYELVTLSDMRYAWIENDFRHVRQDTIDRIMAQVLKVYMGDSAAQAMLEARGTAMALFQAGRYGRVVQVIEDYEARHGEAYDMLKLRLAQSYFKMGQIEKAHAAYTALAQQDGEQAPQGVIGAKKLAARAARLAGQGEAQDPAVVQKQEALDRLAEIGAQLGDDPDLDWLIRYVTAAPGPTDAVVDAEETAVQDLLKFLDQMKGKKEYRRAQLACEEALATWPNEPRLHFNLAFAFEMQGMIREAVLEYVRVVEIDGAHAAEALDRASTLADTLDTAPPDPARLAGE